MSSSIPARRSAWATLRKLLGLRNTFQKITLLSVTGEPFLADYTKADELTISNAQFVGMPLAFADVHFFEHMKMTRSPALLLGMDALAMFARVTVDFQNNEVRFQFPRDVETGTPVGGPPPPQKLRARFAQ